jgi:hypothetical protein
MLFELVMGSVQPYLVFSYHMVRKHPPGNFYS